MEGGEALLITGSSGCIGDRYFYMQSCVAHYFLMRYNGGAVLMMADDDADAPPAGLHVEVRPDQCAGRVASHRDLSAASRGMDQGEWQPPEAWTRG